MLNIYTGHKCPYEGDVRCNKICYQSYWFCNRMQWCYDSQITNCSKLVNHETIVYICT